MLSSMGSSSRFTVEAMIHGYHEYKKGESMQLLTVKSSCSFHANGRRASFIIQGAHKSIVMIKGWLRQTT